MKLLMKHVNNALCALVVSFGLTACGDSFLDKQPDERIDLNAKTLTDDQVTGLLNAAYPGGNYGWIGEISSDNIMDNNAPHMPTSILADQKETHLNLNAFGKGDDELFRFEPCVSDISQDTPYSVWEDCYSTIAQCNVIINLIDEQEKLEGTNNLSKLKKAGRGEAKVLRAYCHFVLAIIFCQAYKDDDASRNDVGIPYVTSEETVVQGQYDRSNVTKTYQLIDKDLMEGLSELDDTYMQKPKWHFNLNAAYAFAARFYLFYHKYDKTVTYADKVLGPGTSQLADMLMSYAPFDNFAYSRDFGNYFQSPDQKNNLMLLSTTSYNLYHCIGYRYAMNGETARAVFFHATPTTGLLNIHPAVISSYQIASYSSEDADYGYYSFKLNQLTEYRDKVAGTYISHVIRREFTCNTLLLERAEAKILRGEYDDALNDLIAYEDGRQTVSGILYSTYSVAPYNAFQKLTKEAVLEWYDPDKHCINNTELDLRDRHENTLDNSAEGWGNAVHMGINIPDAAIPYMNCLNDMKRYETMWEGFRFFDLKRWGIKYAHMLGSKSERIELDWNDLRRAVEVPSEARQAGMASSRSMAKGSTAAESIIENTPSREMAIEKLFGTH